MADLRIANGLIALRGDIGLKPIQVTKVYLLTVTSYDADHIRSALRDTLVS
ncbi:hypothetical protein HY419_00270 [candidate division WWE3 bacterium]|nr:hypothetical protein [candidate division WWE3 bacterium]